MTSSGSIDKLRNELKSLQNRGGIKPRELEKLAEALGRKMAKRGKEPTWVNSKFRHLRPISIPRHSGDLNKYTARGILRQLEEDLELLEAEENE